MSDAHAEWELKAVAPDWEALYDRLLSSGAELVFEGRLEDRRFDTETGDLIARDHVLRLRAYRDTAGRLLRASLDWKGATERRAGYKVREERSTPVGDPDATGAILERLGYRVSLAIDRTIAQFSLYGAAVRLERYPRMDDLVEVEGTAHAIEAAVKATGIARASFTSDRLAEFVARFEARTGTRAALSDAEARGGPKQGPTHA
jgi:adenylate cyclase class IV